MEPGSCLFVKKETCDVLIYQFSLSDHLHTGISWFQSSFLWVNHKNSFLGKESTMRLEKTLEVLDTLEISISNLNARSGFISSMTSRGNKISILAFEVANTISKGGDLFQSLSEENVNFLKKEILHSEGVRQLNYTYMKELLAIDASDKRFGDLCKDPLGITWDNTF